MAEPREIRLLHQAHSPSQADIRLVEWEGVFCVMRDYSAPRSLPFRRLCRWALRREVRVHRMLEEVCGIPKLIAVLDKDRYLIEYIDGHPLSDLSKSPPDEECFLELSRTLRTMHEKGVAHGDLRNKNILVRSDGKPYIIDFSTAWWSEPVWRRPLFRFYKYLDKRRLAKSKAKFAPETLSAEERNLLEREPWFLKIGRFYRHGFYPLVRNNRKKRHRGTEK